MTSMALTAAVAFVAGVALCAVYLRLVARSVAAIGRRGSLAAALFAALLRLAAAGAVLWLAATQGAVALLATAAGFAAARPLLVRRQLRRL